MGTNSQEADDQSTSSDIRLFVAAGYRLFHSFITFDFGFPIIKYIALIAAIFLLILDGRKYSRNHISRSLLIIYMFFTLPPWVFYNFRGEFGKGIALIAVILRLFSDNCLKFSGALVLIVVAPDFANTLRSSVVGVVICLIIACVLLLEYIQESYGFSDSCTLEKVGIILLLVYPIWTMLSYIVGGINI